MMTSYSVIHRGTPKSFNSIAKANQWELAKEVAEWREAFGWEAKAVIPRLPRPIGTQVDIVVLHHRKSHRGRVDTVAPYPAYKGAQDGLVDARVLKDDDPRYVRRVTFEPAVVSGFDGLELVLTPVGES